MDKKGIGIKALEYWKRLKMHEMLLARYLRDENIELLWREIELSRGIKLKTMPWWLVSETRLVKHLESGTKRESVIVIIVENSTRSLKLCSKGLRFRGALKMVEKYWTFGQESVCISCADISHDPLRKYGDKTL